MLSVVFLGTGFLTNEKSGSRLELEEAQEPQKELRSLEDSQRTECVDPDTHETCSSTRMPKIPDRYVGRIDVEDGEVITTLSGDPLNYDEAINGSDSRKWREAMDSEIQSMYTNRVWNLVNIPEGKTPIGCKWIFKKKIGVDGSVETYKARLVAKGYRQRQGIDYDETFSPVAMIKSIRILLAIAAYYDYEVWQMDVKTAFLNGDLEEEVYMTQPEGYTSKAHPNKLCHLQRSIYGLKQASRSWNKKFDHAIKTFDFI